MRNGFKFLKQMQKHYKLFMILGLKNSPDLFFFHVKLLFHSVNCSCGPEERKLPEVIYYINFLYIEVQVKKVGGSIVS